MNLTFNKAYWKEQLQYPDWYIRLERDLLELFFPVVHDNSSLKAFRHDVYDLVQAMLEEDEIPLAKEGANFDEQRGNIDTIVIHHTEEEPKTPPEKISAIGLIRVYAPKYLANDVLGLKLRGEPVWSGHFYNEKQVFFGYHWYVYPDGQKEQILKNESIGWHSGNWNINTRSIGIVLSGDYEHSTPPLTQIQSVADIITKNYSSIHKNRIVGHREVKKGRTCPGDIFLEGWKKHLIEML